MKNNRQKFDSHEKKIYHRTSFYFHSKNKMNTTSQILDTLFWFMTDLIRK